MDNNPFQEYDLDILSIAQKVFSDRIKDPFTYQIIFDPDERIPGTSISLYIFEQLLIIFTEGLKIYYKQPQIAIENISPKEFYDIQQYFKSLGFILNCQVSPILNEDKINAILSSHEDLPALSPATETSTPDRILLTAYNNSKIESTGDDLKDYTYTLTKDTLRYIISFDHLPHSSRCKT